MSRLLTVARINAALAIWGSISLNTGHASTSRLLPLATVGKAEALLGTRLRTLLAFHIIAAMRCRRFPQTLFVVPLTQCGDYDGSHQRQSNRNIKSRGRENKNSSHKKRNDRHQLCMMKDVIEDEKQQPRRDHREATMKRVDETKAMPEDEARGAKHKQYSPDCDYDPGPPFYVS